jgi:multidrug efflux pump subunit AcrA (membrane-fusion protein)
MMSTWKSRTSGCSFLIAIAAAALGSIGCRQQTPPAPPAPEVVVAQVVQQDVPIFSEAVGTTEGFVNA